jgi:glutamate synthase (NADPH/NADH) small chain
VKFRCNTYVGRDVTLDQMLEGEFDAAFLGTGAGVGNIMEIERRSPAGRTRPRTSSCAATSPQQAPRRLPRAAAAAKNVVVIGGGDTAMDCVRTAIRLAPSASCVYRRTGNEMLGRGEERKNAREEGVDSRCSPSLRRIIGDDTGKVVAVELQKMELGEPDASGRRSPKPIKGSEYTVPADTVAIAIGYGADPLVPQTTSGLKADRKALLQVDQRMRTSRPGVFVAG